MLTVTVNYCYFLQVIEDSTPEAEQAIVDAFVDFVLEIERDRAIPDELQDALCFIESEIHDEMDRLNFLDLEKSPRLTEMRSLQRKIHKYSKLNVFGYNSSKYDLQILMHYIIRSLENRHIVTSTSSAVSVLKKGQAYFSVSFQDIVFKDLMSFTSPMSLDKYMQTWLGYSAKLVNYTCNFKLHL